MAIPASPVGKPQHPSVSVAREQLLEKIRADKHLPTLGVALSKVIEITSSNDDSIADLARYILADVALTQQILRLSNTITYRSASGGSVTTISRAIFLLGFDTIKANAIAALLVDGFRNQIHAELVRKELVIALCASVAAREIGRRLHYPHLEEAAVAALFKNLGKILVAFFEDQVYQQILKQSVQRQLEQNQICIEFFGCSFEKLGETVMHDWRLPESIIAASQNTRFGNFTRQHDNDQLMQIAMLSEALGELIASKTTSEHSEKMLATITGKFGQDLHLTKSQLKQIVQSVELEAQQLAASFNVHFAKPTDETAHKPSTAKKDSDFYTEFALPALDLQSRQSEARFASGKPKNARDLLLAGVQDAAQMLSAPQLKLNDVLLLCVETLQHAMGFRFATACLTDLQRTRCSARLSVGSNYQALQKAFQFTMNQEDNIFELALRNNTDLFIEDIANERIQQLLPSWFRQEFAEVKSFIVLPLMIENSPIGLIYADRVKISTEGIAVDETALIKTMKGQLISAMSRRAS